MKRILATILTLIMVSGMIPASAIEAKVRIMDLTHIKGVRETNLSDMVLLLVFQVLVTTLVQLRLLTKCY